MPAERGPRRGAPATLILALVAVVLGGLHALSFAPWTVWWLQVASLAAFLVAWGRAGRDGVDGVDDGAGARAGRRAGWLLPYLFGVAWFSAGLSWMFISMHRYGGMPAPMAAAAVVLLSMYLSLFPLTAFCLASRWQALGAASSRAPRSIGATALDTIGPALTFGALWTLAEWARGWMLTGFPWLATGYAHVDAPLAGFAPLAGVYAVSGLAAMLSWLLADAVCGWRAHERQRAAMNVAWMLLPLLVGALARQIDWSEPVDGPLKVRLLQGNVPQQMKFAPGVSQRTMQQYANMATQPSALGPLDLVVFPETAWTEPWQATPPAIVAQLLPASAAAPSPSRTTTSPAPSPAMAIGMPAIVDAATGAIANSVLLLRAERPDDLSARYDKHHLVPFGEFVPWGFQWFVDMMRIPLGSFARGSTTQPPLAVSAQRVAFNVCYEDLFGEELAFSARADGGNASVLINVSNIGWFGDSHVLTQHLQISRMRAIELARPMLRATNTGVTASIDARGVVRAALPPYQLGVLDDEITGTRGDTPFARFTHLPALLASLAIVVAAALRGRRQTNVASR